MPGISSSHCYGPASIGLVVRRSRSHLLGVLIASSVDTHRFPRTCRASDTSSLVSPHASSSGGAIGIDSGSTQRCCGVSTDGPRLFLPVVLSRRLLDVGGPSGRPPMHLAPLLKRADPQLVLLIPIGGPALVGCACVFQASADRVVDSCLARVLATCVAV